MNRVILSLDHFLSHIGFEIGQERRKVRFKMERNNSMERTDENRNIRQSDTLNDQCHHHQSENETELQQANHQSETENEQPHQPILSCLDCLNNCNSCKSVFEIRSIFAPEWDKV